jgi:putative endonuclease
MPYTYMVQCSDGRYYVGSTWDLDRRLAEHNAGTGAEFTKRRRPVHLVWNAQFDSISDAFAYEKRIQGWRREKREALVRGDFAALPELASRSWWAQQQRGGT